MRLLQGHPWPGNVRELFSVLESALIRSDRGSRIEAQHLPEEIREGSEGVTGAQAADTQRYRAPDSAAGERDAILAALQEAGGVRAQAASLLGMGRTTLWRKMREYGIEVEEGGP